MAFATLATVALSMLPQTQAPGVDASQLEPQPGVAPRSSPLGDGASRRAQIGRVAESVAPRIDGSLTDPCWDQAPQIGPLITVEPFEQLVPPQRTIVRLLHDQDNLYMAIQCFDTEPDGIRGTIRERDGRLDPDDRVEWIFDTFSNSALGYWFQIGAGGSRGDALVGDDGTRFTKSWDTIWNGRSKIVQNGWQAEVAIPFRSIAFAEGATSWGFNFRRQRRQDNSEYRWASAEQGLRFFRLSEGGQLAGFGDVEEGYGVDVVPFVSVTRDRRRLSGEDWRTDVDAGGEVFVRLTPSMTAALTTFTDFAETESDQRQINLTRFPLFFPEKRDFFLQDSLRFSFGSQSRSLLPFFSRRIGLASNEKLPIRVGAKLSGEVGPWEIGALAVQTAEGDEVPFDRELGVVRVARSLGERSKVGLIGTAGRPTERGRNAVLGVDWFHREPEFLGDTDLRVNAYALGSQTSGPGGEGGAAGLSLAGDSRETSWELETRTIGAQFNPELGFVRRRGIHDFSGEFEWQPRQDDGGALRNWDLAIDADVVLDTSNRVTDMEFGGRPFGLDFESGDEFSLFLSRGFERLDESFNIFGDVVIDEGEYWQTRYGVFVRTSEGRPVSLFFEATQGDLFNGDSWDATADVTWRPGPLLRLGGRYSSTMADIAGEEFESRLGEARIDLLFSPDVSLRSLVQYDNQSENLGLQSRFRWIMEPGSDLFVVLTSSWLRGEDDTFRPDGQNVALKLTHTLRF